MQTLPKPRSLAGYSLSFGLALLLLLAVACGAAATAVPPTAAPLLASLPGTRHRPRSVTWTGASR